VLQQDLNEGSDCVTIESVERRPETDWGLQQDSLIGSRSERLTVGTIPEKRQRSAWGATHELVAPFGMCEDT